MNIDFANLRLQYENYKDEINRNIQNILNKSNYILGEEVDLLEEKLQNFTGVKHAITCSSGTDALLLALMALDIQPDDEIITTPFTWISTSETIALLKAKPVFVDIDEETYNINANLIEDVITDKTKAILPVSLFGQPPDLSQIQSIADKHNLKVIIDGAQSFGSTYKNLFDSNLGDISITSFFPSKPLGCYGDGGSVFSNNDKYAEKIKMLRVHGQNKRNHHKYIGIGGRLDTMQAGILLVKLKHFSKEIKNRQKVASKYDELLSTQLKTPVVKPQRTSVWAQYTIRLKNREIAKRKLKEFGIPTAIYYPVPLHMQECFKYLNYKKGAFPYAERLSDEVISLPMNPFLKKDDLEYISSKVLDLVS